MTQYIKERYGLLINGEWVKAEGGRTFDTLNPATGEKLATCADASAADVERAVRAARAAQPAWAAKSVQERAALLLKIADKIDERAKELATVETLDNGKPIRETTLVDVPLSSDHFRYFAGCIRADEGEATMIDENTLSIILREPIGVVGQIVPWNFPLLMGAWKIAPAIAAGNTVVIKSSSTTPLSLNVLGEILNEILPPGVVNVITGRGSVSGQAMLENPGFDKLAFTGSAATWALPPRSRSSRQRSNSVASPPTSTSTTARWTRRLKAPRSASSSTKARSAARARAFSFRKGSTTNSSRSSPKPSAR